MRSVPFVRIDFVPSQCNLCCHKGQLYTPAPILRPWPTKRLVTLTPMLCMGCVIKWVLNDPAQRPGAKEYYDSLRAERNLGLRSNWRSTQRAASTTNVPGGVR